MKNRVIATLLCITTVLGCLTGITVPVSAANTEGYYTYTVSNGEATITDVSTSVSGDVVIPDTLGGYPVVKISGFDYCRQMTSLTIPATVTEISAYGFTECSELTNVYYHGTLAQWCEMDLVAMDGVDNGYSLWWWTDNLYINGVKICGDLVIPEGVSRIGIGAFYGCKEITSVTIPEGVTTVGISAFAFCTKLKSVVIPASVTTIYEAAFYNTTNIYYNGNLEQWANINFERPGYGFKPFASNSKLYIDEKLVSGDVVIPDGVTNISKYTFGLFSDITALTIPASVTNIEAGAVSDLDKLTGVWVSENNQNYCSDEFGVLFNKNKTELIAAPKTLESYTIPSGVIEIAGYAFYKCSKLIDIVIPEGVEYISDYTFYYCTGLESVTIPDGIKGVGMSFGGCKNLSRITFEGDAPDRFEIGWSDRYSFEGVTATAYYPAGNDTWTSDVMQDYGGDITWVPYEIEEETIVASGICGENLTWELNDEGTLTISGTGAMYDFCFSEDTASRPHAPWVSYKNDITTVIIKDGVTSIGDAAFRNYANLTNITIPDSVTSVGIYALEYCVSLSSDIVFGEDVVNIDWGALGGCENVTNIMFKGNAPTFWDWCFYGITATAYYPAGNDTWTSDVMQDYGGDITWVPYEIEEELKPGDIDGNGEVNRDDVVQLLLHISMPAAFPISVPADFNGDGQVTRDDVIQLLLHVSMPDAFPL